MRTWWQEAHLRFSFQARPSLARKARLRSAAFWTSAGTASAAGRRAARANRTAVAAFARTRIEGDGTRVLANAAMTVEGDGTRVLANAATTAVRGRMTM